MVCPMTWQVAASKLTDTWPHPLLVVFFITDAGPKVLTLMLQLIQVFMCVCVIANLFAVEKGGCKSVAVSDVYGYVKKCQCLFVELG